MTFLKALLNLIAGGCALPAATVEGTLCATHDHAAAAADTHGVCILVAQLRCVHTRVHTVCAHSSFPVKIQPRL
jgi:hypothetical protein